MREPLTLSEIVAQLGGRVVGSADCRISQVGSLARATGEQISFVAHRRHLAELAKTRAGAVVLPTAFERDTTLPRIVADDPYLYFARVSRLLNPTPACVPGVDPAASVHPLARVSPSARIESGARVGARAEIGERAWIGAGCHVGEEARLGEDSRLYPTAVVYDRCVIGARVVLHAGVVIGADGFGYARDGQRWVAIPQIGRVLLGDDVEVGANTTIDRGAMDDTVIEEGVKLDNQIHVAHNVRIGAHTAIAACVGIAGSAIIGRNCEIGGAAMIHGHIRIADGSRISPGTLVSRSVRSGTYTGIYPFDDHASWIRNAAGLRRLSTLIERVRALEKRLMRKEPNSE
ncbi:MAG: UDP-3-O-(3-hydroxymyristoyl) glucosamine N-acyltransferase [Betaproteobacteria bacterium SG8_39]|nr:MAG: UDP-3-O-(3-hydroxymyristoyl) glucosamine N-acyltransferase [Betaproteobacteria bacterium SG8_39]